MDVGTWIRERWRWAALAACAACAIAALALDYYRHESRLIREQAYRQLGSIARLKAGQIEAWRKERIADALVLSRSPLLRDAIQRYLGAPGSAALRAQVVDRLRLVTDYLGYRDVLVAGPDGNLLFGLDPRQHELDASARQLAVRAAAAHEVVFGDFSRCPVCHEIHLDLAAPILDPGDRTLAVLLLRNDPKQSLYPLIESWPTPSKTAETLLVRREGGEAVVLNTLRFRRDTALTLRIPLDRVGRFEGTDYRGRRVLAELLAVPGSPWHMIAKVDTDEILAELHYRGLVILGFALLSVLLAAGGVAIFYHRRQRDLYRQLHAAQMERQALTAHYEYVVKYAHDAMILANEEMRIVEANDRALVLYECSREELSRMKLADLRAPGDPVRLDLHDPALNEGISFETEHRRKDGTFFPVEVSARVIEVDGARYYHEIIRDITDRKTAEAALRASEELFRTTLYSIGDAVITTDRSGRVRSMNSVAEALTGWTEAEASGRPCGEVFRVFSEETGEQAAGIVERVLREGVVIGLANHSELERRDGSRLPVEDSGAPIRDATGAVTGVVLVFRDVSAERANQRALRESENRFRRLAENAPDIIYRYEFAPVRRFSYVSPAATPITGYTPEEFYADPDLGVRITPPERRPVVEKLFRGEQVLEPSREVEWICKDGRLITVEVHDTPVYDEAGALVAIEGIARDITERRRNEEALRRLSLVVEQAPVSIVITDKDANIEYVNPAFTAITGYTRDEVLGKNPRILQSGETPPEVYRDLWSAVTAGREWRGEFRNKTKDGRVFCERAVIAPLLDSRGKITHFVGIKEDITENRKLEQQLLQAQKMEAVGRLAGGVAHDFNNLLTVINGYSELLRDRLAEGDPLRDMAEQIRRAGERAADLTQQLLAFSRKQPARPQPLSLNELVSQSKGMLERLLGEDIELITRLAPGLGLVMADPGQMHQILMNIAVNARDAMPGGGTLTVETANVEVDHGYAGLASDAVPGSYVVLAITDTGIGMDAETRERIFEPFFTTKEVGKGTGLGLSTVYGIVRQYGGWITVSSEPDRGSTFRIHLPRMPDATAVTWETEPKSAVAGGSETILVVEDQAEVRKFAVAVLNGLGYRVLEAARGEDALLIAGRHAGPIQLLLTDAVMPGMTGMELAVRLRSSRPDMAAIFMSGYGESVIARDGMISPDVNYLAKPFSADLLARKVREALDSRRPVHSILVVDDEEAVRNLFRNILAGAGYAVTAAADGKEAMKAARQQRFDLVITDLVMPEQEGLETIRALRKERPDAKLVAVSGAFHGEFLKVAEMLGASASLMKPVSPNRLLATVQRVLSEG